MGGDEAALLRLWREKWGEAEPEGRAKFRRYFPKGFRDPLYLDWERGYKWTAHQRWNETLAEASFSKLLKDGEHREIAANAEANSPTRRVSDLNRPGFVGGSNS